VKIRQLLAAGVLALATCGSPPASTAPSALVVLGRPQGGAGNGYELVRLPKGDTVTRLPSGQAAFALSGGGDIVEAYLARSGTGAVEIDAIQPNQGFALRQVATLESPPRAALLVRAELTNFVGLPNVLIVLTDDGRLLGYQHGVRIWSSGISGSAQLRLLGGKAFAADSNGWWPIDAATGILGPILTAASCLPGPIALVGGKPLLDCGGALSGSLQRLPAGPADAVPIVSDTVLVFAGDEVWRVGTAEARRLATGILRTGAPVATPDGKTVYLPTADGVERVDADSGSHGPLLAASGISSIALSRDANFLYVIEGGRFTTYRTASGTRAGSFATDRTIFYLVAGG